MKVTDLKPNEVIHCKTHDEAIRICGMMHEAGMTWCNGNNYENNDQWDVEGADTCYDPSAGEYSPIRWYKHYTIHPSELFQDSSDSSDEITEEGLRARGFERQSWNDDGERFYEFVKGAVNSPICIEVSSDFKVELCYDDSYLGLPAAKTLTDIDHLIRLFGV
jgi:hypothetical protein